VGWYFWWLPLVDIKLSCWGRGHLPAYLPLDVGRQAAVVGGQAAVCGDQHDRHECRAWFTRGGGAGCYFVALGVGRSALAAAGSMHDGEPAEGLGRW
jgi:hypothetical protein